ncbi:MAG: hypothetical protein FJ100_00765 [Deltaproteobacteria bacterium]|nr:hypothetical protein [Deltaproteobacteria bacterium]
MAQFLVRLRAVHVAIAAHTAWACAGCGETARPAPQETASADATHAQDTADPPEETGAGGPAATADAGDSAQKLDIAANSDASGEPEMATPADTAVPTGDAPTPVDAVAAAELAGPAPDAWVAADEGAIPDGVSASDAAAVEAPSAEAEFDALAGPESSTAPSDVAWAVDDPAAADGPSVAEVILPGMDAADPGEAFPADAAPLPAAATTHNVLLVISAKAPMAGASLTVYALAPGQPPPDPQSGDKPAWQGVVPDSWPVEVPLNLKPGSWQLGAQVKAGAEGGPPLAVGAVCVQGQAALVTPGPTLQTFKVNLLPPFEVFALGDLCAAPSSGGAKALLKVESATHPPNTKDGGPHLMQALVHGDRLWVAGSQDGLVSFDFPGGAAAAQPFANWQVHGGQFCNRAVRVGARLFCSSRAGYLHIAELQPDQKPVSVIKYSMASSPTEGMAHRDGQVYVAIHGKGLVAIQATPPHAVHAVTVPADVTEAWDVAALGLDHLVVANGAAGLVFGSLAGPGGPFDLQPLAKLPLPGVSAYLQVDNTTLAVGGLGGGAHLVDIADPAAPKLVASWSLPLNAYGLALAGDHLLIAAGAAILVAHQPAGAPWHMRGGLRSDAFALDIDAHGSGWLSAEFTTIRRSTLDPKAAVAGPVLVAPRMVTSAPAAVGSTLAVELLLHNAGGNPLSVSQILWQEQQMGSGPGGSVKFVGPWNVPAHGSLPVQMTVKKLVKGVLNHQFLVMSDDPNQPQVGIPHHETTWLHTGDKLPKLPVYSDGKGNKVNLSLEFAGKVGVLLVAAHSCPVAFQALAAARRDLGPLVGKGAVAAVAINPWDKPDVAEVAAFAMPFPVVYSGLTTADGHDWSEVLDVTLGQPMTAGPPMPITYVTGKDGKLVVARWGYDSAEVLAAVAAAVAK